MDLYGRLLHDVLFPGFEALRGRPTTSLMRFLDRTQWSSLDELTAIQSGLLRRLLRHAYQHTDWYRARFDERGLVPADLGGPEDLVRLPVLDKADARATLEARSARVPPRPVVHKATSGSTGLPMKIAYNAESRHWRDATRWRGYGWAGYRPGDKAFHFWGAAATPPGSALARWKIALDRALNRNLYVDCAPQGEAYLAEVVERLRAFGPRVLLTYSQAGAALARHVLRTGARTWRDLPVLCGAEQILPHDRAALEEAFGPVFETYGAREVMMIGAECEAHEGLHTAMETMIVEVIVRNPDGSSRAARPGESGEVVLTDLHNLAQPMIRYAINDRAVARAPARCACGRWLARIGPIEGRLTETLRDGAGNPVNGLIIGIAMLDVQHHARQFQAHQHADGRLTIRVVPADARVGLPPESAAVIEAQLDKYLPGVPVRIEVVAAIPAGAAGKRRFVVVDPPEQAVAGT
jgi:phenylacetate-CoA ligase